MARSLSTTRDELAAAAWATEERRIAELRRETGLARAQIAASLSDCDEHLASFMSIGRQQELERLGRILRAANLLRTQRGRVLLPHKVLEPVAEMLSTMHDYFEAIGVVLEDTRWLEAAEGLSAAATWTRSSFSNFDRELAQRNYPTAVPATRPPRKGMRAARLK
jgi:hypothetical protein